MARKCKPSWIDSYLEYTSVQESPTAFHEWVGMMLLSTAVGRHIWIPRIKYTIYPNMFVILVAGSAKCRKSVAISIGMDILRSLEKPPMIFAQKITTEALIQALELAKVDGASAGLICASELAVFMGSDATKSGIIPALTDLYDSPSEWVYHTRGRGKEVLRNVTLCVLAASTRTWLKSAIPIDAIGGGFTSRIVFVCQDKPSQLILFPEDSSELGKGLSDTLRNDLIYDLNEIRHNVRGPISFTPEARRVATEWYRKDFNIVRDPKLDGYFGRKHDTMFKLASLMSLGENSSRVIEHTHINRALLMLEENEKHLETIISSVVSSSVGGDTERVLELIKRHRRIKHSELLRKCWRFATAQDVSSIIRTLVESNEIDERMASDNKTRIYIIKERGLL